MLTEISHQELNVVLFCMKSLEKGNYRGKTQTGGFLGLVWGVRVLFQCDENILIPTVVMVLHL